MHRKKVADKCKWVQKSLLKIDGSRCAHTILPGFFFLHSFNSRKPKISSILPQWRRSNNPLLNPSRKTQNPEAPQIWSALGREDAITVHKHHPTSQNCMREWFHLLTFLPKTQKSFARFIKFVKVDSFGIESLKGQVASPRQHRHLYSLSPLSRGFTLSL